ncbi:MAG TPA: tripartite tricarboxylate transporter substrate binding protein [Burkholderiales bacterium]|nr:tripartite tricarboxylate transporter substrate binding protein [Burkholderiales bacterium]
MQTLFALMNLTAAAALLLNCSLGAQAQTYPSKPIRVVVGAGAGGPTDLAARMISQPLTKAWGVPVVVDNRAGAGGMIGADLVAKSTPDGYTVFAGSFAPNVLAASRAKVSYDAYKGFAHVTVLGTYPMAIVVRADSRFQSLEQLIKETKERPSGLNYASGGVGASSHLFVEMMNMRANVKAVNVPFQGGGPALNALLGQQVDFAALGVTIVHAQAERVRALAVTSATPHPKLPGVPPVAQMFPGFDAQDFASLHMPAATPRELVAKVQRDVAAILAQPDVRTKFEQQLAMQVAGTSPAATAEFIRKEIEKWRPIIKATGVDAT